MPSWPATLPDSLLVEGYRERPPMTGLRFDPDAGPAIQRRRLTANVRPIVGQLHLTKAQVAIFDDFWINTLANGSLEFDWTHPRTGASVTLRFVNTEAPEYAPAGGPDGYSVPVHLEIMP